MFLMVMSLVIVSVVGIIISVEVMTDEETAKENMKKR